MATIRVNDVDFFYERHGDGHPLMLISGYTGDHTQWSHLVGQLCRCI